MKIEIIRKVLELSGFKSLNPVQKLALKKGLLESKNLVVSAPTASGKTLVAEIAGLNTFVNQKKKMLYLCPLVALASEKFRSFKRKYEKFGIKVALSVGDLDSADPWLQRYDWIICSNEKMDSLLRHGAPWVENIGLIVVDEIHLLTDPSRGPTLEVLITKLREMLPKAQFIALSATISNAKEIAEWLNAELVQSDWRPVKLYEGIAYDSKIKFFEKDDYELREELPIEDAIVENVLKLRKQALFFVATRKSAEALAEKLGKITKNFLGKNEKRMLSELANRVENVLEVPTKQCKRLAKYIKSGTAFHHSGLLFAQRSLIEENFRKGLVKVIVATPGLCIVKGQLVHLSNGMVKKIENVNEGDEILSLDLSSFQFVSRKVLKKEKRKVSGKIISIQTTSGHEIFVTTNHPFLVHRSDGIKWVEAKSLLKGDYIAYCGEFPVLSSENKINLLELLPQDCRVVNGAKLLRKFTNILLQKRYKGLKEIARKYDLNIRTLQHYRGKRGTSVKLSILRKIAHDVGIDDEQLISKIKYVSPGNKNKVALPKDLKLLSRFCGILLGDGSLLKLKSSNGSHTYLITITSSDERWLSQYRKIVKKLFGVETKINSNCKNPNLKYVAFKSKIIGHILLKLGIPTGRKAHKIRLPFKLLQSDELIKEVIGGFFDADGSINKAANTLEIYSASKRFIEEVHITLLRFKIFSRRCVIKPRATSLLVSKERVYKLTISGPDVKKFLENIKMLHHKKAKGVKKLKINNTQRFYSDIIPFSGMYIGRIIKEGISTWKIEKLTDLSYWNYKNGQNMSRKTAIKVGNTLASVSSTAKFLLRLAYSPIRWERIKAIKVIEKNSVEVFDLTIKDSDNFLVNGFVVHNSYGVNLPSFRVIIRDSKRYYPGFGAAFIPVLEAHQMLGRCGRPGYDEWGEGILVAKNEEEAEELTERYIFGEPEEIVSKLAVEPVLRMHTLALIATGIKKEKSLLDFFSKTFYAYQYGDISLLKDNILKILEKLVEWKFVFKEDGRLRATRIGKRISELYIDPLTAHNFIRALERTEDRKLTPLSLLQLISNTLEMRSTSVVRTSEFVELSEVVALRENEFLQEIPEEWDLNFDDFLRSVKTALMFEYWINEATEDEVLKKYNVTPGELYSRLQNADWLLYALHEITLLLGKRELLKHIRKVRLRVKYGVKEELLPLVRLRGIGRVRARRLYNAGLRSLKDLRKVPLNTLSRLIGLKVARSIKEQLGERVKEEQKTLL